jgi:hypothetical protein
MVAVSDALDAEDCIAVSPSDVEDGSSTSSSSHDYPFGQVRLYLETRENSEVDAESEESSEVEDEEVDEALEEKEDPVVCNLCSQAPCDWETFGEEIWEECNSLKEGGLDNKAVRFHAYKMYTHMRHGVLQRFDRRPFSVCVRGEIMDAWPEANHVYVGFQQAINDVANYSD